jgi:hypothetical protein
MHADDRRTRFIALLVITLVFVVSMTALVYWAVNVASGEINSNAVRNVQTPIPSTPNKNMGNQGLETTFALDDDVTVSRIF